MALVGVHLMLMVINKHTQFAGPGRTNSNVVGYPMMPVYMSKMGGFFFITFGVIVLIASLFTINPIWNYGPYDPSPVSAGTQPDWYIGFADGGLRLVPPHLESVILGYTFSWNILLPLGVIGIFIVLAMVYPFLEAWVTGDKREHHIAQRPRNAATRTAIGAAGVTFYAVLWAAASSDIIATHFWVTMEGVIHTLQALLFIGPVIAYFVTKRICIALQRKDREIALHGFESGRIVRLPGGEYIEVHQPVDAYERWRLVDVESVRAAHRAPERPGPHPVVREHPRVAVALVLRGPARARSPRRSSRRPVAHQHHSLDHIAHEEAGEIQAAHERAGLPDAVAQEEVKVTETGNRPSNVMVAEQRRRPEGQEGARSPRRPLALDRMPRPASPAAGASVVLAEIARARDRRAVDAGRAVLRRLGA